MAHGTPAFVTNLRALFPEFASAVTYPDATIQTWAGIGEAQISADRFGTLFEHASMLFVAHNLKLVAGGGNAPGGVVSSKTVGSVTVSYDTGESMLPGAGHWNQTVYGRQFIQLSRLIGAGCVQL